MTPMSNSPIQPHRQTWTAAEVHWLQVHLGRMSTEALAAHLGRSLASVRVKMGTLLKEGVDKEATARPKPKRKCHVCGKPTFDYMCEDCRRKWRQENGVSATAEDVTTYVISR